MAKIEIDSKIEINIDTEKMVNVPDEKLEQVIGQIIYRFGKWNCDRLNCRFWMGDEFKMEMGVIWRDAEKEFTFHT